MSKRWVKEYQYCIDFVICDPPRIEPVSRFSSGFIAKESGVMSVRLLGLMPEQTDAELYAEMRMNRFDTVITLREKEEIEFLRQWQIDIRWETDQPDPSYIPESKQVLYLRPKGQPTKGIAKLLPEDYDRLRRYPYLSLEECLSLMLEMPYEQTIIAIQKGELDIQVAATVQKKINELLLLLSRSFHAGELQDYRGIETDEPAFKTENFLEWAKKKGFALNDKVRVSEAAEGNESSRVVNQNIIGPQQDKRECQEIARSIWIQYPTLAINPTTLFKFH